MNHSRPTDPVARFLFWLPLGMIAFAILASVLALPRMPEQIPVHYGLDGRPTRMGSPTGVIAISLLAMVHSWIMVGLVGWALTSNNDAAGLPPRVMPALASALTGLLFAIHVSMLANGLGYAVPIPLVAVSASGLLFMLVGYKMRGIGPNPYFGVRTPTTLRDPEAWRRANEVGSRGFIYAGAATLAGALLPPPWPFWVLLGSITLAAAAAVIAGRRAGGEAGEHA
jgi:uncharacterized membrane protein